MKSKTIIIVLVSLIASILIGIGLYYITIHKNDKKPDTTLATIDVEDIATADDLNMSLYEDTVGEGDDDLQDYIHRVLITNMNELAETAIPDYGLNSLETYLTRYLDYYLPGDTVYEGKFYRKYRFEDTVNDTHFYILLNDEHKTEIECYYNKQTQRYDLYSDLDQTK